MDSTTSHLNLQKRTFGEQLLAKLVSKLPKESYFAVEQPKLLDRDGVSWKPDFVIVCARLGVLILEIKDWVSIVEADRDTVTIQKQDNTRETLPNPVNTAQNYAYILADMFQQREELLAVHRGIRKLAFPWQYAVALPNLSHKLIRQIETAQVWEPGVAFSRETLKNPEAFEAAIRNLPWRFTLKQPIHNDTLDVIRGILNPSVKILNPAGEDIGTESRIQSQLITENLPAPQLPGMVEEDKVYVRLVRGVAGSGKTLVLLRRALHLQEQYPEQRMLVLAFNRDLSDDLRRRVNQETIEVMDFHQLCARINGFVKTQPARWWLEKKVTQQLAEADLPLDFAAEEIAWRKEMELFDDQAYLDTPRHGRGAGLSRSKREVINTIFNQYLEHQQNQRTQGKLWADWDDLPLLALEILQTETCPFRRAYDVILIDETQDFAPVWFKVIKQILKPSGSLFLADDPTQSLFRYYSWKQKGVEVVGCTKILRVPFRSSRQISQAAHSLIQADTNLNQNDDIPTPNFDTYTLPSGPLPSLIACPDESAEATLVTTEVLKFIETGIPAGEIAVLTSDKTHLPAWADLAQQGVYVNSFAKMKGLEFKVVFLPHLHNLFAVQEAREETSILTEQRRKLFTAMTRARENLIMTYSGELPQPLTVFTSFIWHETL